MLSRENHGTAYQSVGLELNTGQRLLVKNISIELMVIWAVLCAIHCPGNEGLYKIDRSEIGSQPTISAKPPVFSSYNRDPRASLEMVPYYYKLII